MVNWWKPETNDNFQEKAQCIIWQYGNYTVDQVGLELNGVNTQGENIADNGGIKEAYKGYGKNTIPLLISTGFLKYPVSLDDFSISKFSV